MNFPIKDPGVKGYMILIGGAEDKRRDRLILKEVASLNNTQSVVVIPTASDFPGRMERTYNSAFAKVGVSSVKVLDIRSREDAGKSEHIELIRQADTIFFTGGDQVKLVKVLKDTSVMQQIRERHLAGATIAGTSAGAVAASEIMIYSGDDRGCSKGAVRHTDGFGFLKDITVDSHFIIRGRIQRLIQHLASGRSTFGIGIAEDTAIVIDPGNIARVIGRRHVTMFSGQNIRYTNYHELEESGNITVDGIQMSCLAPGTRFDLNNWEVIPPERKIPGGLRKQPAIKVETRRTNT